MPSAIPLNIIDFHNHHVPARFKLTAAQFAPANQRARWEAIASRISDEGLLLKDVREGQISGRVVNIPTALIADAEGRVPHATIMAMNDELATLVARYSGQRRQRRGPWLLRTGNAWRNIPFVFVTGYVRQALPASFGRGSRAAAGSRADV